MSDTISRKQAIDAILGEPTDAHYPSWYAEKIKELPSAEPSLQDWQKIVLSNLISERKTEVDK